MLGRIGDSATHTRMRVVGDERHHQCETNREFASPGISGVSVRPLHGNVHTRRYGTRDRTNEKKILRACTLQRSWVLPPPVPSPDAPGVAN
jgi:hypothetical protein